MIRLLHLSDVHLGKTFRMLGEKGAAQRRALQAAFSRAIDLAIAERVHLALIAGDLFDTPKPSAADVELVVREFRRLDDAGIRVALVAGNHDVAEDGGLGSADQLRAASPRLILFGATVEQRLLPDLDLTVTGRSADPGAGASALAGWPQTRITQFAVGLTHGSVFRAGQVEGAGTIHPQEIRELGLDYLALGDWHSASEILPPPTPAWYAGSPELLAYDQENAGHVLLVEIPAPGAARVVPTQIGRRRYRRLEVDAGVDEAALRQLIAEAADPDLVCDVVVSGLARVDRIIPAEAIERDLREKFFRLRVQNHAHLWLDDEMLATLSKDTVLGRFVRVMREQISTASQADRPVLEEALQVGVAILRGREVLA